MILQVSSGCGVAYEMNIFADELVTYCPKTPWDVMGCQVATCLEALFGVSRLEGLVFP